MMNNHSFWQHKYGDYAANAALPAGSHETDVLIIEGVLNTIDRYEEGSLNKQAGPDHCR